MTDDSLLGVIYPVPAGMPKHMFLPGKNIFVKYPAQRLNKKSKMRLTAGMKIYFYESKSGKVVVGESIISQLTFLPFSALSDEQKKGSMIPISDLNQYAAGREDRTLIVMRLEGTKQYKKPLAVQVPVNMAGRYVSEQNISEIFGKDGRAVILPR